MTSAHSFDVEFLELRRLLSATSYTVQKLVSDGSDSSSFKTDTRLKNPWGLAVGPRGIEVADNGTGVGTMYDGNGNNVVGTVKVPGHGGAKGAPTGVVFNSKATDFGGAQFIFVTENGTIDSWSGSKADKTATIKVDSAGSVYKGAALGTFKKKQFLYVANFTGGTVDVYDSAFKKTHVSSKFPDATLPKGFSPFNVTNIGGDLYVAYAKRTKGASDETAGAGLGVVDIFSTAGKLLKRFATGALLNAPWGVALAPSNFGTFSGNILVGNFGDGKITAFDPTTGASKGQISDTNDKPIVLEGLWGLAFGNNKAGNLTNGLYFGAGTNDEENGLYGRVIADQPNPSGTQGGGDGGFHYALHRPVMSSVVQDMFGDRQIGIDGMII
jgi:uncharacterized protein (TIGR03118 family)